MVYFTRPSLIMHAHTSTRIQLLNHKATNSQRGIRSMSQGKRHRRENLSQCNAQPSLNLLRPPATDNQPPASLISKPIQKFLTHYLRKHLRKQVYQVRGRLLFLQTHSARCHCFATLMIWYALMFLLLYRLWSRYTFVDQLVITKHVSSTFNWDPEHMKFVSKWFNQFNRILQCSEFTTKRACFNCVLPLDEHDNWRHTTKQQCASLGSTNRLVSNVIIINKQWVDTKLPRGSGMSPWIASSTPL